MPLDYDHLCRTWDPWQFIPALYNLGVALTRGQVQQGRGAKPALLWENASGQTASYTYAQLDALTDRFASSLRRLGIHRGDRVFLRLPNRPEFYFAALAVAKLGGVFIPSSTQFREAEVCYRLNDSEAVAAVTTRRLLEPIDGSRAACPALRHVVVVEEDGGPVRGEYLDCTALIEAGEEHLQPAPTRNEDLAFLAYTSGTTGDPKGVVHLQRYPIAYESLVRYWHAYRPEDIVACPSELGWLLPVASTFLYALAHGVTVVLLLPFLHARTRMRMRRGCCDHPRPYTTPASKEPKPCPLILPHPSPTRTSVSATPNSAAATASADRPPTGTAGWPGTPR